MASIPRRPTTIGSVPTKAGRKMPATMTNVNLTGSLIPPSQKFSPFEEIGAPGVAIFGGRVISREKNVLVAGAQRWTTYSDLVANTSIVAAAVRYFLNVIASAKWTVTPPDDKSENTQVSDFIDDVLNSMTSPLRTVARRMAMYRFQGFNIQEWVAKRREDTDSKIGLEDIEARPAHTIDRWNVSEKGDLLGVWQLSPQTNEWLYLPRPKLVYMVEDTLTDSPEGIGLFRHCIDAYLRLQTYLTLEGRGFERDLRGIPIGRIPYTALNAAVKSGKMTNAQRDRVVADLEAFVKMQARSESTSICLDSAPYVAETEGGKSISGVMQYGLELLNGQAPDFAGIAGSIQRLNEEMARILGVEHLLLGGTGQANRSLAEDKSRNFYLTANGSLDDIVDSINKDVVNPICDLNGIPVEQRPKLTHSDISFRSVGEITASLAQMATAGAVLTPDDPVIEDVREMLGVSKPPEMTPQRQAMLAALNPPPGANNLPPDAPGANKAPPKGLNGLKSPTATKTPPKRGGVDSGKSGMKADATGSA